MDVRGFETFPERVHLVRWGKRRYLLPDGSGVAFVNAMHHGFEPRDQASGTFLLADGDERKRVSGLPDLPPSLAALVRKQPLVLRTVRIEPPQQRGDHRPTCVPRLHLELPAGETLVPGLDLRETAKGGIPTPRSSGSTEPTPSRKSSMTRCART